MPMKMAKSKKLKPLSGHEVVKLQLNQHTDWRTQPLEDNYVAGNHVGIHSAGGNNYRDYIVCGVQVQGDVSFPSEF